MTVDIYRTDDETHTRIAVFENGVWLEGSDNVARPEFYEDAPEEVVLNDFNGPHLIGVDRDAVEADQ